MATPASSSCSGVLRRRQAPAAARASPYARKAAQQQQQQQQQHKPVCDAMTRRGLLDLAVTLAMQSLDAAVICFGRACGAPAGSPAALAALDAAEAGMAATIRRTTLAVQLASACLAESSSASTGGSSSPDGDDELQHYRQWQLRLAKMLGGLREQQAAAVAHALAPHAGAAADDCDDHHGGDDDDDDGEEVSSGCYQTPSGSSRQY